MARNLDVKNYLDPFYSYLHQYTQLRKDEVLQLLPYMEIKLFEKKAMILNEGEVDHYFNIVMKGIVRKYIALPKNREVTLQLATEGHFIQSERSFHSRAPSELSIQAVEQSVLIRLEWRKMEELMKTFYWAESMSRLLVTYLAAAKEQRQFNIRMKSAKERFLDYAEKHPQMMRRVPQNILASYLNINPQTFSRLKHFMKDRIT